MTQMTAAERDLMIDVLDSHMESFEGPDDRPDEFEEMERLRDKLVLSRPCKRGKEHRWLPDGDGRGCEHCGQYLHH